MYLSDLVIFLRSGHFIVLYLSDLVTNFSDLLCFFTNYDLVLYVSENCVQVLSIYIFYIRFR